MSLGGNCSNLRNSMKEPFEFAMLLTFTLKSSRSHGSWCILFKRQGFFIQVYMQNVLSCLVGHYNKIYLNGQAIYNIARTSSCFIFIYFNSPLLPADTPSSDSRWQPFNKRTESSSSTLGYCRPGKVGKQV